MLSKLTAAYSHHPNHDQGLIFWPLDRLATMRAVPCVASFERDWRAREVHATYTRTSISQIKIEHNFLRKLELVSGCLSPPQRCVSGIVCSGSCGTKRGGNIKRSYKVGLLGGLFTAATSAWINAPGHTILAIAFTYPPPPEVLGFGSFGNPKKFSYPLQIKQGPGQAWSYDNFHAS